jgi:hypothetical protein
MPRESLPENAPEVALFITTPDCVKPFKIYYQSIFLKRRQLQKIIEEEKLAELIPYENGGIEIELRNRAFHIKSKGIRNCQVGNIAKKVGIIEAIWPNQDLLITIGEYDFKFMVKKLNY